MLKDLTEFAIAVSPIVAAIASTISVIVSMQNASKINNVREATEEIHKATNSMKDQLVRVTAEKEHAAGVLAGRQEITNEAGAAAVARETEKTKGL